MAGGVCGLAFRLHDNRLTAVFVYSLTECITFRCADGVELKGHPGIEAAGMMWPFHLDPMKRVYPALGNIQCPVSILAGSDASATNPTEFIALYIQDVAKDFSHGRFERYASPSEPFINPLLCLPGS